MAESSGVLVSKKGQNQMCVRGLLNRKKKAESSGVLASKKGQNQMSVRGLLNRKKWQNLVVFWC